MSNERDLPGFDDFPEQLDRQSLQGVSAGDPVNAPEFTVEQIEAAIPLAIRDHEFTAALGLVRLLALRDPDRARVMLDMIHAGIGIGIARARSGVS